MSLKILNIVLCVMLINILGNCAFGSCSQNGDGITDNSSNNNSKNAQNIQKSLPLTFGPRTLDELKSNPDFIAAYGSIPTFATLEERKQWLDKLNNVYQEAISEMSKYEYPNGPVTAYGYTIDGVLQVGVNKTVEKPFMDEIYKIFDSKATFIGIKEVPVVFVHQGLAVPVYKITAGVKTANSSTPGEKNIVEINKSSTNNSNNNSNSENSEFNNGRSSNINNSDGNKSSKNNYAPGFGFLGSLTCLYGGWRFRK